MLEPFWLKTPLRAYAASLSEDVQSASHIKPIHRYLATRLVLEGGFLPEDVRPRPPIVAKQTSRGWSLELDPDAERTSELAVIGGMKAKRIDVVVSKDELGPVMGISVKGTVGAYRNLTNRMEEAIGDCTNIHAMYPGFVYGFLHIIRANRTGDRNDIAFDADGAIVDSIRRYAAVLAGMTDRRLVRNDLSRYERVALILVESQSEMLGNVVPAFPADDVRLDFGGFFEDLYQKYDLRYPFMLQQSSRARRQEWLESSPLIQSLQAAAGDQVSAQLGYIPRLSA